MHLRWWCILDTSVKQGREIAGGGVYVSAAHLKRVQVTAFECSFMVGWISDYCHSHSPDCCVATKRNKRNTWWSHDSIAI